MEQELKQKQIEEMYKIFLEYKFTTAIEKISYEGMCEHFYNAGYRKIPENAVVLTEEELTERDYERYNLGYETHRQESQKREDYIKTLEYHINDLERALIIARKETAEKFAERLKSKMDSEQQLLLPKASVKYWVDEICKEITEDGKVCSQK